MNETVAALQTLRQKHSITVREISAAIGTTERSVARWFSNSHPPSAVHLTKIKSFIERTKKEICERESERIKKYRQVIIDGVYSPPFVFIAATVDGKKAAANTLFGRAWTRKSLNELKEIACVVGDDRLFLEAFDELAKEGRFRIIFIFIPKQRPMGHEIYFQIEVGMARRSTPFISDVLELTRDYRTQPLNERELKDAAILQPSKHIQQIRQSREDSMKKMFGDSGLEAEIREHREGLEDEVAARNLARDNAEALKKIADKGDKGDKKMGLPGSEYDTLPSPRIKTREFEEVKIFNDSRVTQVMYCAKTGNKLELEPGQSGLIFKLVKKKFPVEKVMIKK